MARHLETGRKGEEIGMEYLKNKGYHILATNWRHGKGEIDIVAREGNCLVMVEIKTRSSDVWVLPEGSVTRKKQGLLAETASWYIYEHNWQGECRFDVLAIVLRGDGSFSLDHFEDAFYPNPASDL